MLNASIFNLINLINLIKDCYLPILILLLLLASNAVTAIEIRVQADRNPVNLNESFRLVFSATESPDGDPDFRILEQDFEILNQSQSSNVSMINGSYTKNVQWTLKVIARRSGEIIIPAIAFGNDASNAVKIHINKGNVQTPTSDNSEDIFIEVSATPENPIVQSQIIYTLRIYSRSNISRGNLTDLNPADVLIERLGEDKTFNTQHNGQTYNVTERKYAIFPQKSGLLTIDPVILTAEIVTGNRRQLGGFFNRPSTRTKRIVSEPVIIDVQAIPENINVQYWLPAEHVYLEQKWSGDIDNMQPGEPITRTLTLMVKGTTIGLLPKLNTLEQTIRSQSGGELKNYPDQPLLKEKQTSNSIIAFREEKTAIIPSKAGVYQLPAIEIPWWNTQTRQLEFARIPATTLTTSGNISVQESLPSLPNLAIAETNIEALSPETTTQNRLWFWLSIIFGLGWIATLVFWYASRNKTETNKTNQTQPKKFDATPLKLACRNNDQDAAKGALLQWGQQHWQLSSLGKIAHQCDEQLQQAILELNKSLYSQQASDWQGEKLLSAFNNQSQIPVNDNSDRQQILQPLYKV